MHLANVACRAARLEPSISRHVGAAACWHEPHVPPPMAALQIRRLAARQYRRRSLMAEDDIDAGGRAVRKSLQARTAAKARCHGDATSCRTADEVSWPVPHLKYAIGFLLRRWRQPRRHDGRTRTEAELSADISTSIMMPRASAQTIR